MKLHKNVLEELTVHPGDKANLRHRSTSATKTDWLGPTSASSPRHLAERDLEEFRESSDRRRSCSMRAISTRFS